MKEIQPYNGQYGQYPVVPSPVMQGGFDPNGTQTIDIPGVGLKRDYAGILEYWQMVRRHKAMVVLATIVGGLVGILFTLPSPRIYQARTNIEIQGLNADFLNMRSVNPVADGATESYDLDIQTQVKILQSASLIDRVRAKVDAGAHLTNLQPPDRLGMWRKALKISPPSEDELWRAALGTAAGSVRVRASGMTRIVDVTCDSTSPDLAADFCNTLTQQYIEDNLEARWKSTEYTGQWLSKQLDDLKVKIEKSEEELQSYARQTGLVITNEKNDVQEARLADLQKELSTAQADRIAKQSKYEMAVASPPSALPEVLDDPQLKSLQGQLADLQAKIAQLRVGFTPNHNEVKRLEAQVGVVENAIQSAGSNIIKRIRNDYEAAQRREGLLASAYEAQGRTVTGKAEETAHYGLLKREVDASRMLYDNLQQKLKEASIASALRASNIRVVDPAKRPGVPYKPDVRRQAMMGLLAGAVLGVGLVVLRERADRTLQDPGDSTYYLGIPELGVIPVKAFGAIGGKALVKVDASNDDGEGRLELASFHQKASLLAESYRAALTSILFSGKNGTRPRVIVLTSASPKEGKTTTACNLAISLADISKRVLVIDADMRRPRLHSVFNVENHAGLAELLSEKQPLNIEIIEQLCQRTSVPSLAVLTSGHSRHNASSLLHSQRLPELMSLVREHFDAVIIDTPPMANIADSRVIARYADALTLVVRSGSTTRDAALLARSRFADDGIPIMGTILNFWNPETPGYSYYKHYYAGYQHYYGKETAAPTVVEAAKNDSSSLSLRS